MSYVVEFPGLGLVLNLNSVAFTVFGVEIYWYGVLIGTGMLLAVLFAFSQCKRFGVDGDRLVDVVFIGLILALVCGRLYYILFSDLPLSAFFRFREGGIAIYGGIIGGFVGAALGCKIRKVPLLPFFDLAGMGFLIGQALGRWGNFFNQEVFGTNTTLPWGMFSNGTQNYLTGQQATLAAQGIMVNPSLPVHPTFLYESLWCALGFLILFLYKNHRKFNGEIFLFYIMWYGAGRFAIEGLRTDSLMMSGLGLRVSQVVAFVSFLLALMIWVVAKVKTRGKALVVPKVPPRTASIKLGSGESVTISWPANSTEPTRGQKQEMARLVLERDAEKTGKAEAKTNQTTQEKPATQAEKANEKPAAKSVKPQERSAAKSKKAKDKTETGKGNENGGKHN